MDLLLLICFVGSLLLKDEIKSYFKQISCCKQQIRAVKCTPQAYLVCAGGGSFSVES